MSGLAAFGLTISAVRALRGQTLAGDQVLHAPREALSITQPEIAIYAADGEFIGRGLDFQSPEGWVGLRIELYLPTEVKVQLNGQELDFSSSASGDLLLSSMYYDVVRCLSFEQSPWAQMFRKFCMKFTQMTYRSELITTPGSTRLSMRAYEWKVEPLAEPTPGFNITGAWQDFIALLSSAGDPELSTLASYIKSRIELDAGAPTWQVIAGMLGLNPEVATAAGFGPLQFMIPPPSKSGG